MKKRRNDNTKTQPGDNFGDSHNICYSFSLFLLIENLFHPSYNSLNTKPAECAARPAADRNKFPVMGEE